MASVSSVKVSILMPVFNAQGTLTECLDSVFSQSLQNFEIIVVNDFSTDKSVEIMQSYNDPRICVIENKNKGIVHALNAGLSYCNSNYVARMDADDVMYTERLEKQYDVLNNDADITLCATRAKKFPEEKIQAGYVEYMRWQNACVTTQDIKNQIYIESPFAHPSVMFRKDHIVESGAYRDGAFPEDYELWLRLFHAGYKMMKLEEVLLDWRESDGRLSRTSSRYSDSAFEKLRALYLAKDVRLRGRDIVFWGVGRRTRQRARFLIDNGIKPSAWIDIDTNKIGNEYHGVKTFSPDWLQHHENKPFVLNYVRNHGAREDCRRHLDEAGYVMGEDYLDVA
ncbi:MAG: glycosyltransferase [Gammaproteobacteria bacterium]|nr:MAG: glycosyltransferase [Gammaproteobacteria bacterium]